MRRTLLLMAACVTASACSSSPTATFAPPTTSPETTAPPATTAAPTTTHPARPTTTTTTPETAPPGGTVALPVDAAADGGFSFSPWAEGFDPAVGEAYLAGAWETDPETFDLVPDLVVEIPSTANGGVVVRPDGTMTVTYRIRPEAVWEDGRPVSGADFAFTYEALAGRDDPAFDLYREILPESVSVGAKSFAYTMARTTIDYERLFAVVLPRHAVEGTDPVTAWDTRPWPSAGPFRFQGWGEGAAHGAPGSTLAFVRNEAYWRTDAAGQPLPYLDAVEFRFLDGPRSAVEAFARGDLDAIDLGGWPDVITRLSTLDGVTMTVGDGAAWELLAFQFGTADRNSASLNRSTGFRRAVAHALDREALADVPSWVNEGALGSFLDLSPVAGSAGWDRYGYDPELAAALLEDACREADRDCAVLPPVVVITTNAGAEVRAEAGLLAADMLIAAGIDARFEVEDAALFFGPTFIRGDWDLGMWAWDSPGGLSGLVHTLGYWDPAGPPPLGANYQRWGTPAVSGYGDGLDQGSSTVSDAATARYAALVAEMQTTVDRDRLAALISEAEEILADQVVIIPLATRGGALAWWSDVVAGVRRHPARPGTWNLERWYRLEG